MRHPIILLLGLVTVALAGPGFAQPVQGDLVVTSDNSVSKAGAGVFYTTWPSTTLRTLRAGLSANAVKTADGNRGVYVINTTDGEAYLVSSTGQSYGITRHLPVGGSAIDLDQDKSYLVSNSVNGAVYRVRNTSVTTFTVLNSVHARPNAICRDGNTGDWVVGTNNGRLLQMNRISKVLRTLYTSTSPISGLAFMPRTGGFAATRFTPFPSMTNEVVAFTSSGGIAWKRTIKDANAVTVNHKTGRIYVATYAPHAIWELTAGGTVLNIRTYRAPASLRFTGIDVWDDQNVTVTTSGVRRSGASVTLSFSRSPNKPYALALSLGQRPGLAFSPNNVLNLRLDPMFWLTVAGKLPHWTDGFAGTLSRFGTGQAAFIVPYYHCPAGSCLYVGGAAVNTAMPDNLDMSNVECIEVR